MPFLKKIERNIKPKNSKFRLISVARFERQKDHKTLIEALVHLKNLSWELFLVGDGPLRQEIKSLVESYNLEERVFFLGRKNNVASLLEEQIYL